MAEIRAAFGMAIRVVRARKDMSTAELARRSGLDRKHLSRIERGEHDPGSVVQSRIAEALDLSVAQLWTIAAEERERAAQAGPPERGQARVAQSVRPIIPKPLLVAAIVVNPEASRREVLMTERRYGANRVWSWPGGLVEKGEAPADAVMRELEEELVLRGARIVRHLGEVETDLDVSPWWGRRFRHGYHAFNFQVAVDSPEVGVVDHEELLRAEWRSLERVAGAVAALPSELADAAVGFAQQAMDAAMQQDEVRG